MANMMQKISRLPVRRKLLLLKVSPLLLLIHAGLRLIGFSSVYKTLKRFYRAPAQPIADSGVIEDICWAVNRAGWFWFADHGCLTQALLGETLLVRRGIPARLQIGVQKRPGERILAHAWVENGGKILIGGKTNLKISELQNFPEIQQGIGR